MGLINDINPNNARRANQSQIRGQYITNLNCALLQGKSLKSTPNLCCLIPLK